MSFDSNRLLVGSTEGERERGGKMVQGPTERDRQGESYRCWSDTEAFFMSLWKGARVSVLVLSFYARPVHATQKSARLCEAARPCFSTSTSSFQTVKLTCSFSLLSAGDFNIHFDNREHPDKMTMIRSGDMHAFYQHTLNHASRTGLYPDHRLGCGCPGQADFQPLFGSVPY